MKTMCSLVVFATVALAAREAVARLGETAEEIAKRYGEVDTVGEFQGKVRHTFKFKTYRVSVLYLDGKSAAEFIFPNGNEALTDMEVAALMEAIAGSSKWGKPDVLPLSKTWSGTETNRAFAHWNWKRVGGHCLSVSSANGRAFIEGTMKAKQRAKAEGF